MKADFKVNTKAFLEMTARMKLKSNDLEVIAKPGIMVISNKQKQDVPVLTGATRASVQQHDVYLGDTEFITDIGPETNYAPAIEYGRSDMPNYPIQPFVRPSIFGNESNILNAIANAFKSHIGKI